MRRILKYLIVGILIALALFQLVPKSKRNISAGVGSSDISMAHHLPADVQNVLRTSCYDCHSNNTVYPWYASFQPVALFLGNHIEDGKKELNFSEFGRYSVRRQYKKLEEINEQVKEDEMPLTSYTIIHRNSRLDEEKKLKLSNWVSALRDSFKASYPADSLAGKK